MFKKKKQVEIVNHYVQAKAKAESAITMFSKAMKELAEANELIEAKKQQDLELIKTLESAVNAGEKELGANLKVMAKLAEFVPLSEKEEE